MGPNSGGICHVPGCGNPGVTVLEFGREESRGTGHQRALICEYHTGAAYDYFEELLGPGNVPPMLIQPAQRRVFGPGARPIRFTPKRAEFRE